MACTNTVVREYTYTDKFAVHNLAAMAASWEGDGELHDKAVTAISARDADGFRALVTQAITEQRLGEFKLPELLRKIAAQALVPFFVPVAELYLVARTANVRSTSLVWGSDMTSMYNTLLTDMSEVAYHTLRDFLRPGTHAIADVPASLEDVLFNVCGFSTIEYVAVNIGPAAVRKLVFAHEDVISGLAPAERHAVRAPRLWELLKCAVVDRVLYERQNNTEKIGQMTEIIDFVTSRGATVFGTSRRDQFPPHSSRPRTDTEILNLAFSSVAFGSTYQDVEGVEPTWEIVRRTAFAEDAEKLRQFLGPSPALLQGAQNRVEMMRRIEGLRIYPRGHEKDHEARARLMFGGKHIGYPAEFMGPMTQEILARPWLAPRNDNTSADDHLGIRVQSMNTILVVLMCARRFGIFLPAEMWFKIFGLLSYGDLAVRFS